MLYAVIAVLTFGILVAIHEWGHFWVARRCGVKVLRFAIGFGPVLLRWSDKAGTEYAICALPLGGYVKMLDEREGAVPESERQFAFNNVHPWRRIAIAAAGPLANFVLAIAAFTVIYVSGSQGVAPVVGSVIDKSPAYYADVREGDELLRIDDKRVQSWQDAMQVLMRRLGESGVVDLVVLRSEREVVLQAPLDAWLIGAVEPDLIESFGIEPFSPHIPAKVGEVVVDSAAERAGFLAGDLVVSAASSPISDWYDWVDVVKQYPDTLISVDIIRNDVEETLELRPSGRTIDGTVIGFAGVAPATVSYPPEYLREFVYPLPEAIARSFQRTYELSTFTVASFGKLLTGRISLENLSGPISIAKVASDSARYGLEPYLNILAILSISLAVLNLMPIPVLDGGHIVFHSIEWIKGSPLSDMAQEWSIKIGVSFVLCLMGFAIYNDLSRLQIFKSIF